MKPNNQYFYTKQQLFHIDKISFAQQNPIVNKIPALIRKGAPRSPYYPQKVHPFSQSHPKYHTDNNHWANVDDINKDLSNAHFYDNVLTSPKYQSESKPYYHHQNNARRRNISENYDYNADNVFGPSDFLDKELLDENSSAYERHQHAISSLHHKNKIKFVDNLNKPRRKPSFNNETKNIPYRHPYDPNYNRDKYKNYVPNNFSSKPHGQLNRDTTSKDQTINHQYGLSGSPVLLPNENVNKTDNTKSLTDVHQIQFGNLTENVPVDLHKLSLTDIFKPALIASLPNIEKKITPPPFDFESIVKHLKERQDIKHLHEPVTTFYIEHLNQLLRDNAENLDSSPQFTLLELVYLLFNGAINVDCPLISLDGKNLAQTVSGNSGDENNKANSLILSNILSCSFKNIPFKDTKQDVLADEPKTHITELFDQLHEDLIKIFPEHSQPVKNVIASPANKEASKKKKNKNKGTALNKNNENLIVLDGTDINDFITTPSETSSIISDNVKTTSSSKATKCAIAKSGLPNTPKLNSQDIESVINKHSKGTQTVSEKKKAKDKASQNTDQSIPVYDNENDAIMDKLSENPINASADNTWTKIPKRKNVKKKK